MADGDRYRPRAVPVDAKDRDPLETLQGSCARARGAARRRSRLSVDDREFPSALPRTTSSGVAREPRALSGRIPQAIEGEQLERAAGVELSARASQVMLCGNPDMVADTTEVLKGRGMRRHRRREPG